MTSVLKLNGSPKKFVGGALQKLVWECIKANPVKSASKIEASLSLDKGSISGTLSELHRKGKVNRIKSKMGGRSVFVYQVVGTYYNQVESSKGVSNVVPIKELPAVVTTQAPDTSGDVIVEIPYEADFNPEPLVDNLTIKQAKSLLAYLLKLLPAL